IGIEIHVVGVAHAAGPKFPLAPFGIGLQYVAGGSSRTAFLINPAAAGESVFGIVAIGRIGREAVDQLRSVAVQDVNFLIRSKRERVISMFALAFPVLEQVD